MQTRSILRFTAIKEPSLSSHPNYSSYPESKCSSQLHVCWPVQKLHLWIPPSFAALSSTSHMQSHICIHAYKHTSPALKFHMLSFISTTYTNIYVTTCAHTSVQ
jgi:S-adenosylmethionine/arginine decarboxylase-like enzyme